ncbi:PREDICTED: uncharacterized protein LOC105451310 [Wasmannia auropunctata]|uniref:uncharacterized protein LOC105451310 n=1 Tax=Wasmannia auropunctata TaxID=64793 RepID=UPI0005EFDDFF|nr:PREDICTED: uncharacterized protein LOC105451310 [Wasmannia auropunctata]
MKENLHRTPLSKQKMENRFRNTEELLKCTIVEYKNKILQDEVMKLLMEITSLSLNVKEILEEITQTNVDARQLLEDQSFIKLELQEIIYDLDEIFSRIQILGSVLDTPSSSS